MANTWNNRMVGDEMKPEESQCGPGARLLQEWPQWLSDGKPSPTGRLTLITRPLFNKDALLELADLLGPVAF